MIKLTSNTSTPVAVNPNQVLYVKEAPTSGCVIVFANEKPLHVKDDYLDVVGQLVTALQ